MHTHTHAAHKQSTLNSEPIGQSGQFTIQFDMLAICRPVSVSLSLRLCAFSVNAIAIRSNERSILLLLRLVIV